MYLRELRSSGCGLGVLSDGLDGFLKTTKRGTAPLPSSQLESLFLEVTRDRLSALTDSSRDDGEAERDVERLLRICLGLDASLPASSASRNAC